jgi:D-tyrosyl-tRNA(Tyr) deacylase
MKVVLQRVRSAAVSVEGETAGAIGLGALLLVGVGQGDSEADAGKLAEKIAKLRVFEDAEGKMNLDLAQVSGEILSVSQFTLFANLRKGNRPSFVGAAAPEIAKRIYEAFNVELRARGFKVETGVFGADMTIDLQAIGPVTICLDSAE